MKTGRLWVMLCFAVPVALLCLGGASRMAVAAGYVGADTCTACHEDQEKAIAMSVHGEAQNPQGKVLGCEGCHGPGGQHADYPERAGTIFAFSATDSAEKRSEMCLSCHGSRKQGFHFKDSNHMKGGVACNDCHDPHKSAGKDHLMPANTATVCIGCHEEMLSVTTLNERHRIWEGVVSCIDCHDPHGRSTRTQLGGFKTEMCFKCHTDKQGPFLYEHGSIRIEGCTVCHNPHGSVNRHMLQYQKVADLCFSCHVSPPSFHSRFTHDTQCTNCHSSIHGSNLSETFLK